jgi:uncharacterized membrane protein
MGREKAMSDLVVSLFGDEYRAEEVRLDLLKKEAEHLVDIEDAVVLVRTHRGKVKLHHVSHMTVEGALGGGFVGTLMGVILLNPIFALFGLAAGTVVGAITGSLSHVGIDEDFMKELAEHLRPGTSALCILVRQDLERVLNDINLFGGKVLHAPIRHEDESKLREVLEAVRAASGT